VLAVLRSRTTTAEPLIAHLPAGWPDLQLSTHRILNHGRYINTVRVRWHDPTSGKIAELGFNGFGTTLRGARQQRRPDIGWARWYGPRHSDNDPTLDSPP
jgi:hypothetical protein